MHSHMGLDSWPGTNGGSDTNEMSQSPVHPELRSLDGFDPWDIGIDIISRGGIYWILIHNRCNNLFSAAWIRKRNGRLE